MIGEFVAAHRAFTVMLVFVVVGGAAVAFWLPEGLLGTAVLAGYGAGYVIFLALCAGSLTRSFRRRH